MIQGWMMRVALRSFSRAWPMSGVEGEMSLKRRERAAAGEEAMGSGFDSPFKDSGVEGPSEGIAEVKSFGHTPE